MDLISSVKSNWATVSGLTRLLAYTKDVTPDSPTLVPDDIERVIDYNRHRIFCRFDGETLAYQSLEDRANRIAHWALTQGLEPGDTVALFMGNCPDYIAIWFGLSKVGVVTAFINTSLKGPSLVHCVSVVEAKAAICGPGEIGRMVDVLPDLIGTSAIWQLGGHCSGKTVRDLELALSHMPTDRPDRRHREHLRGTDVCFYLFTSGTTGLPKAARLTQARTRGVLRVFVPTARVTSKDRVYVTLPLYHATGGICAVGCALMTGASLVLSPRFSASRFWKDVADEGVTIFPYVGELCRYLMNNPPHPNEQTHSVRVAFGNGMGADIWQAFQARFNIKHIREFYASTEGNVALCNLDARPGAIGRVPRFLRKAMDNYRLVKFDIEAEMPVRGPDGLCVEASPGEPAEMLGRVGEDTRSRFEGYTDREATEKKLLRNAFVPGDVWFRTGDLMRQDEDGYIYFVDRIGDTFRWKGENVSTQEVGAALAGHGDVEIANVYGVDVPGQDGKAGMAAIRTNGADLDARGLYQWLAERLPGYAVPRFVRVSVEMDLTGTFKLRKTDLVKQGFDPEATSDRIFYADPEQGRYVPLDQQAYQKIAVGQVKL